MMRRNVWAAVALLSVAMFAFGSRPALADDTPT
jgi:hypothetical protein